MKFANMLRSLIRPLLPPLVLASVTGGLIASMILIAGPPGGGRADAVMVSGIGGPLVAGERTGRRGLRPGSTERRTVRLTNLADTDVRIATITAVTGEPVDGAHCLPVVALLALPGDGITVPARGEVDVPFTVRLSTTVQSECRDLRFPLHYTAVLG